MGERNQRLIRLTRLLSEKQVLKRLTLAVVFFTIRQLEDVKNLILETRYSTLNKTGLVKAAS